MEENIVRIVYTGGPCAGKTTALSRTFDYFSKAGFRVVIVPEAATLLINAGLPPHQFTEYLFQDTVLNLVLTLENEALKLAQVLTDKPGLMIFDRGTMDGKAYCGEAVWQKLLAKYNVSETQLRDHRYDAVFHLVTAADGASHFYTKADGVRQEEPDLAVEVDRKLRAAWSGHPQIRIIDNSTPFEGKIQRVLVSVAEVLAEGKKSR
jgi:predicted ATPase